ncbi:MAG: hypothetical protein ACH350_02610 [Parachlamydiaceae bacterium]
MKFKYLVIKFVVIATFLHFFTAPFSFAVQKTEVVYQDSYVHGLSSLHFYLHEYTKNLSSDSDEDKQIVFSDLEVKRLWNKVFHGASLSLNDCDELALLKKAKQWYKKGVFQVQAGLIKQAQSTLENSYNALEKLLNLVLEKETGDYFLEELRDKKMQSIKDPNIKNNPYLSDDMIREMAPYLLPIRHHKRKILDSIFLEKRVTTNKTTFYDAGFRTIAKGPRSFILVAKHPKIPRYLVKAHLDTQLTKKYKKDSWEWLARRCEGARKIREIIRRRKIRFFTVPEKRIYCLPADPSPPDDANHTRHIAILLVTDMQLTSENENHHAWRNVMTQEHLNELYEIIVRAKGSSYRPDNIAYTIHRTFAFIDTEYPSKGPDFKSIRHFLNSEMRDYWEWLIRNGGPSSP